METKTKSSRKSKLLKLPFYELFIATIFLLLYANKGFSQSVNQLHKTHNISCKGFYNLEDIYPHYLYIDNNDNLSDISLLLKEINNTEISEIKIYDRWLLKENREGIKIYYRWIQDKNYMELKLDNTNLYSTSISFHPLIYCWECIDNSSNQHTHVFMNPNSSMKINIKLNCENQNDTDMVLEKLIIYK